MAGVAVAQGLVVKGDRKAWSEIQAALNRLDALKSYRARGPIEGGGKMLMEVVNPDRSRVVTETPGMKEENIEVGKEQRWRIGNGPWQCTADGRPRPGTGQAPSVVPPGETEVTAERGPRVKIQNDDTQSYRYWFGPRHVVYRLFVLTKGGLPRRIQVLDAQDNAALTLDYYDFNAAIRITLPKCEQRN
jgi:hypothetical protein